MADERMPRADRRRHVLDTARELVLAEGFHSVTLERVAGAAGVSRPLLYKLFGGLPGLLTSLVDRETATALDGLHRAMSGLAPGPEGRAPGPGSPCAGPDGRAATDALHAMLDATDLAPLSWRILLSPPRGGPIELYDRISAGRALARSGVEDLLSSAQRRLDDPQLTARLVHLLLEDLVRLHVNDPARYPRERVVRQAEAVVGAVLASADRTESVL